MSFTSVCVPISRVPNPISMPGSARLTLEQLRIIEQQINAWIRADQEVDVTSMKYTDARKLGAMALFGEKYGDVVRVISVGCAGDHHRADDEAHTENEPGFCSRELCGGTHVMRTGEGSVSAGLRRIEALTGRGSEEWIEQQRPEAKQFWALRLFASTPILPEKRVE